ncbi:MAG: DUF192 domain-containing protein [Polyangiaceae bacterium]
MRRGRHRAAFIAAISALTVIVAACDSHVEEPVPGRDRGPAGRCMKTTPEKPDRVLKSPGPDPACPPDPGPVPQLKLGVVRFPDAAVDGGAPPEVAVEIAQLEEERMRGLMYRHNMAPDNGMWFVFDAESVQKFWMKNTCIPLDMVFVGADGVIVGIEENVPTLNENTYTAGCMAQYVLETNAGWTRKHGVKAGQKVTWARAGVDH